MTDETTASMDAAQQREYQRRMSAPAAYADAAAIDAAPRPTRRSSLIDSYDFSIPPPLQPSANTMANPVRRSSIVDAPHQPPSQPQADANTNTATDADANELASTLRRRTEKRPGCETMFSMDEIFSRDLRITGVSKKGASWRYHIEVLNIRNSLLPFTERSVPSSSASSPASSSIASMASLPSAPPSVPAYTLPPLVRYSVMRRYNDFRQLYLYLVDYFGAELADRLPKFPDGGLFSYFRGDDPKLLQFRKEQLQRFLRALDENEDTKWSRALRVFLNPELDELSTIGGATFAELVENFGRASGTQAPPPSASWAELNLSRINTTSGYVSLSHVKSPEIRFKKQPSDGRGDWKRRKIERANRDEEDDEQQTKRQHRVKRLELEEPPQEAQSDTGDEDEDEDDGDTPKKSSTELMKLLSLAPLQENNQ